MNIGSGSARALLTALLTVAIPACQTGTSGSEDSPSRGEAPLPRGKAPETGAYKRGVMPPELRADYIRAVQARAGAAYRVELTAAKTLRTRNPAQKLVAELSPEGVQLTNEANRGASGGLALAGFGCEQERTAVRAAEPRADGNRVEYDRGELVEWYVSGPLGLEQGFTVGAPPACRAQGGGQVVVELSVRGQLHGALVAQGAAPGAEIELRDDTGHAAFTYSDLFARDAAGRTVAAAMTMEGDRLLLHVDDADAVYPLQIDPLITVQQAKLVASDGEAFDRFGISVALSGNTAVIGADRDDDKGTDAGAAYVFVRSGTSWTQQAKLTAADGAANDNFGFAVALSGDTALVGSIFNSEVASGAGAAYIFVRSGTSWTQQAKLTAADAHSADHLGLTVALSGDTALVATTDTDDNGDRSGSAYVFVRSGTSWTQQAKLLPADGAERDQFGISATISGDTAIVGAYGDDDLANSSGSAFVFVRSGTSWSQQAKLLPDDGQEGDQFGVSVAVAGDTALVGANLDDDNGTDSGSAYVFVRSGTSWSQQAKLLAADGQEGDNFGFSVALLGDTALLGAPDDSDLGAESGSAYVFVRSGTAWTQQAKVHANDGTTADFFGASVTLSENTALVGAEGRDDLGSSSGAAYVYKTATSDNGGACATNTECGSGFCVDGVCCDSACGGGDPNSCQACSVATGAAADGTCGVRAAGIVCRAAAGACDAAEKCNGTSTTCPADGFAAASTVCRAAAGVCDVAETCTGSSAACPTDRYASSSTVCRPADGSCDMTETCTGTSVSCPTDRDRPNLSLCTGGLLGLPGLCLGGVCVL
jgi:FG-GAP repeat